MSLFRASRCDEQSSTHFCLLRWVFAFGSGMLGFILSHRLCSRCAFAAKQYRGPSCRSRRRTIVYLRTGRQGLVCTCIRSQTHEFGHHSLQVQALFQSTPAPHMAPPSSPHGHRHLSQSSDLSRLPCVQSVGWEGSRRRPRLIEVWCSSVSLVCFLLLPCWGDRM